MNGTRGGGRGIVVIVLLVVLVVSFRATHARMAISRPFLGVRDGWPRRDGQTTLQVVVVATRGAAKRSTIFLTDNNCAVNFRI